MLVGYTAAFWFCLAALLFATFVNAQCEPLFGCPDRTKCLLLATEITFRVRGGSCEQSNNQQPFGTVSSCTDSNGGLPLAGPPSNCSPIQLRVKIMSQNAGVIFDSVFPTISLGELITINRSPSDFDGNLNIAIYDETKLVREEITMSVACGLQPLFLGDRFGSMEVLGFENAQQDEECPEPTPAPTRAPTAAPVPSNPFSVCFSEFNTVQVKEKGPVPIGELEIGDFVKGKHGSYSQVYSYGHFDKKTEATYLQVTTEDDMRLEISDSHMIYVQKGENGRLDLVPAGNLKVGDYLVRNDNDSNDSSRIVRIRPVRRKGAYAPYTTTGDIEVNGVLASNYIAFEELQVSYNLQQHIHQALNIPHRVVCMIDFSWCRHETYQETTGFSTWLMPWYQLFEWYVRQSAVIQWTWLMFVAIPATVVGLLVDKVVLSGNVVYFVAAAVVAYKCLVRSKKIHYQ